MTNLPPYPINAFNFSVEIKVDQVSSRVCDAAFSECDGLDMSMEVKTIREGGNNARQFRLTGPVSYGQLTLKRGVTGNFDLWDWFQKVTVNPALRSDANVVVLAADRSEKMRFLLTRCVPVKLKAPGLNAVSGTIAIEEFQLAYETLTLQKPDSPGS